MTDSPLGFSLIDADNHYYEAEDAFTRHGDEDVKQLRQVDPGGKASQARLRREYLGHARQSRPSIPSPRPVLSTSD